MTFVSKHKITRILTLPVAAPLIFLAWAVTEAFTQGNETKGYWATLAEWVAKGPAA